MHEINLHKPVCGYNSEDEWYRPSQDNWDDDLEEMTERDLPFLRIVTPQDQPSVSNVSLNVNLMNDNFESNTIIQIGKKRKLMPIVDVITKNCPILILTTFLNHHEVAGLCKVNHTWRNSNKGCSSSLVISALFTHCFKLKHYNRLIDHNKKFNLNIFPCERARMFDMDTFLVDQSIEYFSEGMVANLPNLQVLVNVPIKNKENIVLFEKLTQLKAISLGGSIKLDSLSVLVKLKNLECLFFNDNRITDECLTSLSSIASLRKLDIFHSYEITDIGAKSLACLTGIEELSMSCAYVTNINFLSELTKLKRLILHINENGISKMADLSPLYTLTMLQSLELHYFRNVSLVFLNLTSLEYVRFVHSSGITYDKDSTLKIFDLHTNNDRNTWELKKKGIEECRLLKAEFYKPSIAAILR